jgi:hypothetical protein
MDEIERMKNAVMQAYSGKQRFQNFKAVVEMINAKVQDLEDETKGYEANTYVGIYLMRNGSVDFVSIFREFSASILVETETFIDSFQDFTPEFDGFIAVSFDGISRFGVSHISCNVAVLFASTLPQAMRWNPDISLQS